MAEENIRRVVYDLEVIEELACAGLKIKEIATKLGAAESTFLAWKKDHPEISVAIRSGRARRLQQEVDEVKEMVKEAKNKVRALSKHADPRIAGENSRFILKTKGGWNEEHNVNITPRPVIIKRPSGEIVELTMGEEDASNDQG